jgi:hypothetical protein
MSEKFTTARITKSGEKFEILVKPEPALEYKMGKPLGISQLLVIDEIYSDAGKGTANPGNGSEGRQHRFQPVPPVRGSQDLGALASGVVPVLALSDQLLANPVWVKGLLKAKS